MKNKYVVKIMLVISILVCIFAHFWFINYFSLHYLFDLLQEAVEESLKIIHDVSTYSLGSLCVTEKFSSLSVPLDTSRFESARQKADLAANLLQDLGIAHHNGKDNYVTQIFVNKICAFL